MAYTKNKSRKKQHGLYKTKTYGIWVGMNNRCFNKNNCKYKNYGDRGITVCEEWRESFLVFYNDMGEKPEQMSLDRIDNDGNYTKNNCRWASQKEQMRNTRKNKKIEAFGKTKILAEWCENFKVSGSTLKNRIKNGMIPEDALLKPKYKYLNYPTAPNINKYNDSTVIKNELEKYYDQILEYEKKYETRKKKTVQPKTIDY